MRRQALCACARAPTSRGEWQRPQPPQQRLQWLCCALSALSTALSPRRAHGRARRQPGVAVSIAPETAGSGEPARRAVDPASAAPRHPTVHSLSFGVTHLHVWRFNHYAARSAAFFISNTIRIQSTMQHVYHYYSALRSTAAGRARLPTALAPSTVTGAPARLELPRRVDPAPGSRSSSCVSYVLTHILASVT